MWFGTGFFSDLSCEICGAEGTFFEVFRGWGEKAPDFFLNRCETLYPALKVGNFKIRGVDKSTPENRKVNEMYATQP